MKSLAIIGMMFCSIGLFAQQSSNATTLKKEKVCVIDRGAVKSKANIQVAKKKPVDARRTSVHRAKVVPAKRAYVNEQRR